MTQLEILCSKLTIETLEESEICSRLTIKTPKRRASFLLFFVVSSVSIVNFEQGWDVILMTTDD